MDEWNPLDRSIENRTNCYNKCNHLIVQKMGSDTHIFYHPSAIKFMDATSTFTKCKSCCASKLFCNLCKKIIIGWAVMRFSIYTQLIIHLLIEHTEVSRCKIHMVGCFCINFEYKCDNIPSGNFIFPRLISDKKADEKTISVCILSGLFINIFPHVFLLKIIDGGRLIDDMCDSRDEYNQTGIYGIAFRSLYTYEKLELSGFPFDSNNMPEMLEIFSRNTYECVICGGEYETGFPSVDAVVSHLLHAHTSLDG